MAKKKDKKKDKKILPGGLTHVQNEFLKHQLKNNPEFVAKYFPNVILHPPSGPLYNVDLPIEEHSLFGSQPPAGTPVKAIYETTKPKKQGPFDYMELEHPTKGAQFTAENVPYDTSDSVLDIQPSDHDESYAYTIPYHMNQDLGSYFIKGEGGFHNEGQFSEPKLIPITKGQSSTIYLKPEMIKDYGTDPKAPRNEMVPTPEWWPNQSVEHVDQAEINKFIKDVVSHEVSHNVSALPEHEGIVSQADEIDYTKLFPQFSSKEAQDAIEQLNILNKLGGAVHSRDYKTTGPDMWYHYPPPSAEAEGMGWRTIPPELVKKKYIEGAKDRELESEYESTLIEYDVNEEELYNRAKDIYKVKMEFPDTYKDTMMYKNNMDFIEEVLEGMPKNVFGKTGSKAEIYLKKIEPQVIEYFTQMKKDKKKDFASGGIAGMLGEPRSGYENGGVTGSDFLVGPSRRMYENIMESPREKFRKWLLIPWNAGLKMDEKIKKFKEFLNKSKERNPEDYIINVADGGRIGLQGGGGGYKDYWKTVQDKYYEVKEIDPEKFGKMSIQDFAKKYFPRPGQAEGGRIGYADGMRYVPNAPLYDYKTDKEGKSFIPYGALDREMFKQELDDPRNKMDMDFDRDTDLVDIFIYYKNQGLNLKDFVQKFGFKNLLKSHRELKEAGVIRDRVDLLPSDYEKSQERMNQNQGGRIGLAEGDTPSQAWMRDYFYKAGYDRQGVITLHEYMNGPIGKTDYANHGPGKAKGGRIGATDGYKPGDFLDFLNKEEPKILDPFEGVDLKLLQKLLDSGMDEDEAYRKAGGKAEGGRIGFKDGEGIMSRVGDMVDVRGWPYYAGEGLKGLVHSVETLSKFPLAAGELGSKLLREKPSKKMFMEAIENITPGSWSENLGLTSLVEGMGEKRPEDAQTVGNLLSLGTEIAVPTGGAFKAGQLLLSKASKLMGKVKDGKTLEKLVDQKLTDSGQSRRDFNIMAATSGLVGALKWLGLGGILKTTAKLKPSDDVVITLKTFLDDSDVMTEAGPVATAKFGGFFDIESLTKSAAKTMEKIMMPGVKGSEGVAGRAGWSRHKIGDKEGIFENVALDEGTYILDALKKAGHKVKLNHLDDGGGSGIDEILYKFKNDDMYKGTKEGAEHYKKFKEKVKKMSERQKMEYHNSITDDYGTHYSAEVEEFFDDFYGVVKKAEGGRIGLDTGGPPLQFGIAEADWKAKHPVQGNKFSQLKDAAMDRVLPGSGLRGSLNMGNFEAFYNQPLLDPMNMFEKSGEPQYGLQYEQGPFSAGIGVMPGGEREYGFRLRKEFNDGGLTKTVPPERGPDPQGLPSALYNGIMRPRSY